MAFLGIGVAWLHYNSEILDSAARFRDGHYAPSCGAILEQASIRPFTDSTDLRNMARSAALRSISTIFSTPLAPITTGTPTYMPLTPYSPLRNAAHGSTRRLSLR